MPSLLTPPRPSGSSPMSIANSSEPQEERPPTLLFKDVVSKKQAHGLHKWKPKFFMLYEDRIEYWAGCNQGNSKDKVVIESRFVESWAEKPDNLLVIHLRDPDHNDWSTSSIDERQRTLTLRIDASGRKSLMEALRDMANPGRHDRLRVQYLVKQFMDLELADYGGNNESFDLAP
eukprot:GEMP01057646.1.p1 GENE.GEMP01057646.1~~GEMP01057646.1.p1  ORF type:complete len:175 (+),score=16.65 GEMP01057646.1:138-662(+)